MYGRKSSLIWGPLLTSLSWVYGAAIRMRQALSTLHVLKSKKLSCPVISVGNITLGGTGKTPTVIAIASLLLKNQKHPVIVSRGYGRKNETELLVVSDGQAGLLDSQTGGDEPVLIGSKLPTVPVIVGSNRFEAAQLGLRRFNADVVVLDDGFQHIQLERALDIVLIDTNDPFGNEKLFPAGILREPLSALKRAHAVLLTKAERAEDLQHLKDRISKVTDASIFSSRLVPVDIIECNSNKRHPLSVLNNSTVLTLSGIARPSSFSSLLRSLGAVVAAEKSFPDHYEFTPKDLAEVRKQADAAKVNMIITTEKDAVRLKHLTSEGIYALRVELMVNEQEEWESFILNTAGIT